MSFAEIKIFQVLPDKVETFFNDCGATFGGGEDD